MNVGVFEEQTRSYAARKLGPVVSGKRALWNSTLSIGWLALLAIALFVTSFEAKAGLYRPEQPHLISKAFKISEGRLERAVPDPPIAIAQAVVRLQEDIGGQPEPALFDYSATPPRPLVVSHSHFFRPPPVRF